MIHHVLLLLICACPLINALPIPLHDTNIQLIPGLPEVHTSLEYTAVPYTFGMAIGARKADL